MSIGTLVAVAESTDDVLAAGRKLRDGRSDPERASYATDLLAQRLEDSLNTFGAPPTQGFDSHGKQVGGESVQDALAIAASQLSMATVALAADSPEAGDSDLDAALGDLATTNDALQQMLTPAYRQGFDSRPASSADLAAAIDGLRAATESTLETIATVGGNLCQEVLRSLPEGVPFIKELQSKWDSIKSGLHLDMLSDQVGRLARLALRLMAAALDRLVALVPSGFVATARGLIQSLVRRLDEHEPAAAVFGSLLNFDAVHDELNKGLGRDGLDKIKLDSATGTLGGLSKQYGRYMEIASNVATLLNLLHRGGGYLTYWVPQLLLATAGAHVVLLAVIFAISVDFVDTSTTVDVVRGVRLTIADAVG